MSIDLTKLAQSTAIGTITQKTGVQNVLGAKANFNTGALEKDTVSFSKAAADKLKAAAAQITEVPEHHNLNGINCNIRSILEKVEEGRPLHRFETCYLSRIDEIDESFEKLAPLDRDIVCYRGRGKNILASSFNRDFDVIEAAKAGDIIVPDRAYSYAAADKEVARNWAVNMMYEIRVPKGAKVSRNKEHGGEVIFPRGAKYRLISKEKDKFGILNVVLEYILPEK